MIDSKQSTLRVLYYISAILLPIIALVMTQVFKSYTFPSRFLFFSAAVTLSAWVGGFGPGLVATLFSTFLVSYFLTEPIREFGIDPVEWVTFGMFIALSTLISWLEQRRHNTERALLEANEQFQVILEGVSDGITAQDASGKVIFANRNAIKAPGFPPGEVGIQSGDRGPRQLELFDEHGNPITMDAMPQRRVFAEGVPIQLLFRTHVIATGEEYWYMLRSTPIFKPDGKVRFAVNIFRDITQRRRSQLETAQLTLVVENQRQRLKNIIANIPGIIWEGTVAPDGTPSLDYVNPYIETMLGYTPEEWQTSPNIWQKIVHPDDWEQVNKDSADVFTGKSDSSTVRTRLVTKRGDIIYIESHITMVRRPDGSTSVYGLILDIGDQMQYERALAENAENLRQSNDELKQFAYIASHDLQEPLRMVTSYLQLIEKRFGSALDESGREFIGYAVDGAARMKELITDLLAYSRVQRGSEDFETVDMQKALEKVLGNLQFVIEDNQAEITSSNLPKIYGSEIQIIQLFQNLISNGIKFRRAEAPKITISAQRQRREWVFSVTDNGIGIEKQYLGRIFDVFQRLHNNDEYEGTGIGLAICKKVIQNHNGRIWVESELNCGTTFYFALPAGRTGAATGTEGTEEKA